MTDPAVEFHEEISSQWDGKYTKSSFGERARLISRLIRSAVGDNGDGLQWLDAGCGAGNITTLLVEHELNVIGVDASPGMLAAAKESVQDERAEFQLVDTIEKLPFESGSFDGVMCSSVVEYVPNPENCIVELARVIKPGGKLVITVANRGSVIRTFQRIVCRVTGLFRARPVFEYIRHSRHTFNKAQITKLLRDNSLEVVEYEYFSPWLRSLLNGTRWGSSLLAIVAIKTSD